MTDYSKTVVEYALAAIPAEIEERVEKVRGFTFFPSLAYELFNRVRKFRIGVENDRIQETDVIDIIKEDLAVIVLHAAAILYELDKNRDSPPIQ
jgi:hypothetical protein